MDVTPQQEKTIRAILTEYAPDVEARVFGSRATHTAKKHSDLDLALVGDGAIEQSVVARLRLAFEESDLPFRVDIVDWNFITPEFRRIIEDNYETL